MENLRIEQIPLSQLQPWARNARTHSKKKIRQISASIEAFGFTNPILLDETNTLIAGHGRLEAARNLGLTEVPGIRITHLSDPEKRALMLADNKIALNAGWDEDLLAVELADLSSLDLSFNMELTGFEMGEIDLIIDSTADDEGGEADVVAQPVRGTDPITRTGDLWHLGDHRVLCGDARNHDDLALLMGEERADVVFTDPPYNVAINGHVSGGGQIRHREFSEASGEMTPKEFTRFLTESFCIGAEYCDSGAVWFVCMDWRHIQEITAAGKTAFDALLNVCVWTKTNGGMGSLYRSQHELVFVFRTGRGMHRNNVQLGRFGRNRTNVWRYPGVNTFRPGRMEELTAHPTAKPVAMIRDALLEVSKRGDIVLDPFLGAGATVIAAERSGRRARGLEIDPAYVDVILRRWRKEGGVEPIRQRDGCTLASLEGSNGKGEDL